MSSENKAYSFDEETWHTDIESAFNDALDGGDFNEGDWVNISTGDIFEPPHTFFFSGWEMIEQAQERAVDNFGEHGDGYLDSMTSEDAQELEELVAGWAEKKHGKVNFYHVNNAVQEKMRIPS